MANHTVTLTSFSHGAKDWWNGHGGTVFRIDFLVGMVAVGMLFLAAFGSLRRRSRNFFAQKVVLVAYLSVSLVSYALGLMQSSPVKRSVYPVWAVCICILAGSTNSITAYSLDDNYQQMRQIYEICLCIFYILLIQASIFSSGSAIFVNVLAIAGIKWVQRSWACLTASQSWNLNKMVADYMQQEHTMSGSSYDAASMKGYRYLVDWPLHKSMLKAGTLYAVQVTRPGVDADATDEVIDVEKIWQCKSLSSEQRDICLSFSLFHLLRRRFFGFECGESSQPKTHDFVFKGLLAKNKNNAADGKNEIAGEAEAAPIDYDWAFKVIEVELAFMYDFFFTKYAAIYYRPWSIAVIGLFIICLTPLLLVLVVELSRSIVWETLNVRIRSTVATTTTADIVITSLLFACIALLELLQLVFYWTTIWGIVYLACRSARRQGMPKPNTGGSDLPIHIKIGLCISNSYMYWFPQKNKCYWQKKLGQYSLLESALYNPKPSKALHAYLKFRRVFGVANSDVIHPVNNLSVRLAVSKPRNPVAVELSAQVKQALVQCLRRTQGDLTNGQSSLLQNRASDLLWACRHDNLHPYSGAGCSQKENQAQFILIWHIATCYCERETLKYLVPVVGGELKRHIDVATQMSKYCAYLVVNAPKLLPGHHFDTMLVFDAVALEAVQYLHSENTARLPELETMSIFHKGVRLWEQLKKMEEGTRWNVLADFWVEMLLYVAPSDNVKEHIESLAKGGELITHFWALLTHAGILDRGPRNIIDIENARAHHHQPAPATSDDNHMQPAGTAQEQTNLLQKCRRKRNPRCTQVKPKDIIEN